MAAVANGGSRFQVLACLTEDEDSVAGDESQLVAGDKSQSEDLRGSHSEERRGKYEGEEEARGQEVPLEKESGGKGSTPMEGEE